MDELERRIRAADPYENSPLPDHARVVLDDIMAGRRVPKSTKPTPSRPQWRTGIVAATGFVAAATILALVVAIVFRPQAAEAVTPAPLPIRPTSHTTETLLEALMASTTSPGASTSHRGVELEGWYLQLDATQPRPAFIQPERTLVEWNEDLSGSSRVVAGVPTTATGKRISPIPESAVNPGTVLNEYAWAPGEEALPFPGAPPDDVGGMRAYLEAFLDAQGISATALSAGTYLFALTALMQTWTLGDAAERAAINVILSADGVSVSGETTDRRGRTGVALDLAPTDLDPGYLSQLVIDPTSWRLLGLERSTIHGLPEFSVPAGSITEYTLWS